MKKRLCVLLTLAILLVGCGKAEEEPALTQSLPQTEPTQTTESKPEETKTSEAEPAVTELTHSDLYLEGVTVENVLLWFNEVVLDGEIINSGDPSRLQKWEIPICYSVEGDPTPTDLMVLESFGEWLNAVEGFPGIHQAAVGESVNLRIHFTDEQGLLDIMGSNFSGLDGAVTFWYDGYDRIYQEVVCVRTDIAQDIRNSVILEELYNGLGPIQDTELRPDSIIYQDFTQPQELTDVDKLLLKLLYHPDMQCGMDAVSCETVIRSLYY